MTVFHWILLGGFVTCLVSCLYLFVQSFGAIKAVDYAEPKGNKASAVRYSLTAAMSPKKKETAFLHLPTYAAGMIFHLGTLYGFGWLFLHFFGLLQYGWLYYISAAFLAVSCMCGLLIFIKRIVSKKMRSLSNPDDYFSNLLVTGLQVFTAATFVLNGLIPYLFVYAASLFLYIPLGKLRHTIYFFAARAYLGIYYGRRGVWPQKNDNA
ncbi:MAG: hypothetical protein KJ607_01360 [Bacteroidetes bacterium]|nr:hypothetical protein [Bacteroidota bacterium]